MDFFSDYLKPEEYDTARRLEGTGGRWKLGKTLDLYLREFVLLGKADVNGDGVDERFYILRDPGWCGSLGCHMLIVEKRPADWTVLCETWGMDHFVWITDRVTVRGYRELEAAFPIYWAGGECITDIPEVRKEHGLPPPDPLRAPER